MNEQKMKDKWIADSLKSLQRQEALALKIRVEQSVERFFSLKENANRPRR